jgi:U3 small nucleolar RNA-associated protein 25
MSVDDPITRLLTLLNVSATKAGKRKRADEFVPSAKLNRKRKSITFATEELAPTVPKEKDAVPIADEVVEAKNIDIDDGGDHFENEGV